MTKNAIIIDNNISNVSLQLAEFLLKKDYHVYFMTHQSYIKYTDSSIYKLYCFKNFKIYHGSVDKMSNIIRVLTRIRDIGDRREYQRDIHPIVSSPTPIVLSPIINLMRGKPYSPLFNKFTLNNDNNTSPKNDVRDTHLTEIYNMNESDITPSDYENSDSLNSFGTLNLLKSIDLLQIKNVRIFQASNSTLNDKTPFSSDNQFAISKLYSYNIINDYRNKNGFYVSNGILFNYESSIQDNINASRTMVLAAGKNIVDYIYFGSAITGFFKDYSYCIWLTLQGEKSNNFLIASSQYSMVRRLTLVEVGGIAPYDPLSIVL